MKKSHKKVTMKKNARRMLVFGLFFMIVILALSISVFKIVREINDKYKEEAELEKKMVLLEEKEENLNNEIKKLQDEDYLARYAREKYFYSKNGELIIRIPTEDE